MSVELLDELEKLEKAATPGPWEAIPDEMYLKAGEAPTRCAGIYGPEYVVEWMDKPDRAEIVITDSGVYPPRMPDAQLIVAARNALPKLIARVRELEHDRASYQANLDSAGESVALLNMEVVKANGDAKLWANAAWRLEERVKELEQKVAERQAIRAEALLVVSARLKTYAAQLRAAKEDVRAEEVEDILEELK